MKTLYVPKGKTLHYERLECQTIIAEDVYKRQGWICLSISFRWYYCNRKSFYLQSQQA